MKADRRPGITRTLALACALAAHGCATDDGSDDGSDDDAMQPSTPASVPASGAGGDASGPAGAGSTAAAPGAGASGAPAASAGTPAATMLDAAIPAPDAALEPTRCTPCTDYAAPELLAQVQPTELDALSGIAVSALEPSVLFAHNDRSSTTVFALALDGSLLARFALGAVTTVDLEDIAVGPCPSGRCLFLADIGGNISPRSEYAILRAPEPMVDASAPVLAEQTLAIERFRFEYEDGAHNAEGILIDPGSGALYVVTKVGAGQPSSVYKLPEPLDPTGLNSARKIADLSVPRAGDSPATATAAHPCGAGLLLRTNDQLYELRIDPTAPFESAFGAEPVLLDSGDEPQSEGVSYLPDGSGFVSSGETAAAPIYRSRCR